jgi:hypothetical protein
LAARKSCDDASMSGKEMAIKFRSAPQTRPVNVKGMAAKE